MDIQVMVGINGAEGSFGLPMAEDQWATVLRLSEKYLGIPDEDKVILLGLLGRATLDEIRSPSAEVLDYLLTLLHATLGTSVFREQLLLAQGQIEGPAFLLIDLNRMKEGEQWVLMRPLDKTDLQIMQGSAKMN
jgi:hypothetical protein